MTDKVIVVKHIFIRVLREKERPECTMLSGLDADRFVQSPVEFVNKRFNGANLLDSWVVPDNGYMRQQFESLLTLDACNEFRLGIAEVFGCFFEAGFQYASGKKRRTRKTSQVR